MRLSMANISMETDVSLRWFWWRHCNRQISGVEFWCQTFFAMLSGILNPLCVVFGCSNDWRYTEFDRKTSCLFSSCLRKASILQFKTWFSISILSLLNVFVDLQFIYHLFPIDTSPIMTKLKNSYLGVGGKAPFVFFTELVAALNTAVPRLKIYLQLS